MAFLQDIAQLPPHIRQQVVDFIEFLLQKYTVQQASSRIEVAQAYPLRGSVLAYDDPFGPAANSDDWEVYT